MTSRYFCGPQADRKARAPREVLAYCCQAATRASPVNGNEEGERVAQVRSDPRERCALAEGFANEREFKMFKVAQAAVNQL